MGPHNGISTLLRGDQSPLSPCHLRIQRRGGCPQERKRVLAKTRITQHLDLALPGLQHCENEMFAA